MAPRFFGQHREIFGWHHEGAAPTRRLGVVLCNSHGEEYLCSHRTIRSLAGRLQAMGFPTLRFDYHGTGDSLGSDRDPQRVRAWTQSVHAAIDELRRASGVDGVVLFGFRLGAALAMMAAAERDDVRALALWSPCARGRAFLRERRALHAVASVEHWDDKEAPAVRGPDDDETVGFFLSSATIADLQGLDVTKLARRPADRILIVGRDGSPIEPGLAERMRDLGAAVDIRAADGFAGMMLPPHLSVIPTQVIDAVTSWTADLAPVDGARARERQGPAPATDASSAAAKLTVTPLSFGPGAALFGVLTEPRSKSVGRPAILMLSIGSNHHVGANAAYSRLAVRFADIGFTSFRFDIGGIGDSATHPGATENAPYPDQAVDDVRAAMAALRDRGFSRFVLMGVCSGAYHAFKTAVADPSVAGIITINGQTFAYHGEPIEEVRRRWSVAKHTNEIRQRARRLDKWIQLLRGRVNVRAVGKVLYERAQYVARTKLDQARRVLIDRKQGNDFGADFVRISERGTDILMVYASLDPGLDYVRLRAGGALRKLRRRKNFRFVEIDGPDHTFTPLWSQAELDRLLQEHVQSRFGGR